MAVKEQIKHPIFRQNNVEDIIEIVLTDSDGDEIATTAGNKNEGEIKQIAQQNGITGPVNLMARLVSGITVGPVQIAVPSPRANAASLFGKSKTFKAEEPASPMRLPEYDPSLARESVQRLDRIATDSVVAERSRVDKERVYWQAQVESEREQSREREFSAAEKHDEQLRTMRENYERVIAETKASLESKIDTLTDSYERVMRDQKDSEAAKIKHYVGDADDKISLVREMSDQTTRVMEQTNQQTIGTLKSQLETSLMRIKELENSREREAEAARNRYEDFRDRMTDEIARLREDKAKAEQSRLEIMLQSQKASSDDIRREVERITTRHEADLKELKVKNEIDVKDLKTRYELEIRDQRKTIESLREKNDDVSSKLRDEATRTEMAILREQANREPLKSERLMPLLQALPMEQRASLISRAVSSDLDLDLDEKEEPKKPSLMDSLGDAIKMLAINNMAKQPQQQQPQPRQIAQQPQQQQPQPRPQPRPQPAAPMPFAPYTPSPAMHPPRPAPRPAPQQPPQQPPPQPPQQPADPPSSAFGPSEEV